LPKARRGTDAYAKAGVDVSKVRAIQGTLGALLSSTFSNRDGRFGEPAIGIGHYAGLIDIGGGRLLAMHTDGVGTKALIAQEMGKFETVGIDCVAMTVNDLICLGVEPVALLDYLALEKEDDDLVERLSVGLVKGADESGTAIVGGETAIMGDVIKGVRGRGFDLVSMGVGVVQRRSLIDGSKIRVGDRVLGISSSGLHSNGYTLARRLVRGMDLRKRVPELGMRLGDCLLAPTRIYVSPTLKAIADHDVHGIAHITGGSFTKLTRLTGAKKLRFDLKEIGRVDVPAIFGFLTRRGDLTKAEMYRTFNMGVGLCLVVPEGEAPGVLRAYRRSGFEGWDIGSIDEGQGVAIGSTRIA